MDQTAIAFAGQAFALYFVLFLVAFFFLGRLTAKTAVGSMAAAAVASVASTALTSKPSKIRDQCSLEAVTALLHPILPPEAAVVSAAYVPDGGSYGEGKANIPYPRNPTNLPELCAIVVNVTSSPASFFRFGIFLPAAWSGRFLVVGNGGFAGGINWLCMGQGVSYGHAVVSTDTGHNSSTFDGEWALNAPEKLADFGHRAIHGSTVTGKAVTEAFYGKKIRYSYYTGSSTGGRQGLREIQLHPESFDGAVIGAPAWWTKHLQPAATWLARLNLPVTDAKHIPPALFPVVAEAVVKQCDGDDGVLDGIVSWPFRCSFDSSVLACPSSGGNKDCLTPAQLKTLDSIYANYTYTNAKGQTELAMPGLSYTSETQWSFMLGHDKPVSLGDHYMQYFLLGDPSWTWDQYTDDIMRLADEKDPGSCTAEDYGDIAGFRDRGGKIVMFHGLSDALIVPQSTTVFYDRTAKALASKAATQDGSSLETLLPWFRYFEVPAMEHVGGTSVNAPWFIAGGSQLAHTVLTDVRAVRKGLEDPEHDALLAVMDWVEKDRPVDRLVATTWQTSRDPRTGILRQRPLCVYPKVQVYNGGNADIPESFGCE